MRYLGIDYGAKKIGIAISDSAGSFAFPREVLDNNERVSEKILQIIRDETVHEIVMGDTRAMSGGSNHITDEAETFAGNLQKQSGIPVHRAREAWSSREASRFAPENKQHDDSAAAAIILQRFLDVRTKSE